MKSVNSRIMRTWVEIRRSHAHIRACTSVGADSAATDKAVRHVSMRGGTAEGGSLIQYGRIVRVLS